jgi:hypothetical protein
VTGKTDWAKVDAKLLSEVGRREIPAGGLEIF